jgi:hypothetical protein
MILEFFHGMKARNNFARANASYAYLIAILIFGWRDGEGNYEEFRDDSRTSVRDFNQK